MFGPSETFGVGVVNLKLGVGGIKLTSIQT